MCVSVFKSLLERLAAPAGQPGVQFMCLSNKNEDLSSCPQQSPGRNPPPPSPYRDRELKIITIEGNIGCGKSTAIASLQKLHPQHTYVYEPVDLWLKSGLLQAMYKKELDSPVFQQVALATLVAPLLKAVQDGSSLIITERSPWSNRDVFARATLKERTWEKIAYQVVFDSLLSALPQHTVCVAYLQAPISVLQNRIEQRARESEHKNVVNAAYLKKLDRLHEDYFHRSATIKTRIDATQSPDDVARMLSLLIATLEDKTDWPDEFQAAPCE